METEPGQQPTGSTGSASSGSSGGPSKLALLVILGAVAAGAIFFAIHVNELRVNCQIGGILSGGNFCTFTNETPSLPGDKCVRIQVTAKRGVAVTYSSPVCSGLMWGESTKKVEAADFDRDLYAICPSVDDCNMDILDDEQETADLMAHRPSPEEEAAAAPPVVVSMEDYDNLRNGMTYKRVRKIIGSDGTELNRNEIAGYTTVMMEWDNPDHSSLMLTFQNGRLTLKSQFRLPPSK